MLHRLSDAAATAARAIVVAAGTAAALPSAYLGVLTVAGLPQARRSRAGRVPTTRFSIFVPAHDEARTVGEALESFRAQDYPPELFDVHVVADNCTDDTADVVRRTSWRVHERNEPDEPGKGPALNWLHDRVVASGERFDAVVIVDADTSLDSAFLREMDVAMADGVQVAQGFYTVRDPEASVSVSFRFAALACRHHLRPLGRCRLGASCGLYGNGMVFARDVLANRRWTGHLVEDAEFQMELLLDGHRVVYVPRAVLRAEMPHEVGAATSQNERWERGRIEMARRYVPRLVPRILTERGNRIALTDATLDHLVPPISVLAVGQCLVTGAALLASLDGHKATRRVLALDVAALTVLVSHVVAGLIAIRASPRHLRSLLGAPALVMWKARLWLSMTRADSDVTWTRTSRNLTEDARR